MSARRAAFAATLAFIAARVDAQTPGACDTIRLTTLQRAALGRDPRAREIQLLAEQSTLRLENLRAERLPALSVEGTAQYQSDVPHTPITVPGLVIPIPHKDSYDARLGAQQRIYDPTLSSRRSVERAQLAESQARVRTTLYTLRQNLNDAYFAALRADAQIGEVQASVADLEAQLSVARARVREGSALASEQNAIEAELLRRRQAIAELGAAKRAALAIVADLVGSPVDTSATVLLVDPATEASAARATLERLRARPEYEQFARTRDLITREEEARSAQDKPRLSAFGRVGYGRPGLNPLDNRFASYWLAGVQVQWSPWTWGTTRRDREVLSLQRDILAADEAAFTEMLRRGVEQDLATIDRLIASLSTDDEIIGLRERIATESRARFGESVITSAEYIDRQTDVLSARTARAVHRVELAQARVHFLTTLGLEVE
jgi:outer membrane protein TolC